MWQNDRRKLSRVVSDARASFITWDDIKVRTFPFLERRKKSCQTSDVIHFCRLVAFFKKTTDEKEISNRFAFVVIVRSSVVPRLFLACFFVNSYWGRKESFIFFRGDDIFIQTKDTLPSQRRRKKKEERKNFEWEGERAFGGLFIRLFIIVVFIIPPREKERISSPSFREKKGVVWSCIDFARDTRAERKRSAKKKKPFWCGRDECERRRCADQDGGNRTRVTSGWKRREHRFPSKVRFSSEIPRRERCKHPG